jgi:hypothetical protein
MEIQLLTAASLRLRTPIYRIATTAAVSGFLLGFDTAVVNGGLLFLREEFRLKVRIPELDTFPLDGL